MTGIGFAAPWVLAVASAVLVPIVAHLARQEDRAGLGFPSLMFLGRVPFPSTARRRIRDRALLALRALALLALVLAFAGPYPIYEPGAAPRPERDTVVLLDESYSMGVDGRFSAARAVAGDLIAGIAPGERVALVAFDEEARILSPLHELGDPARQALARARPGHRGTDVAVALQAAERLLREGGARAQRVVLVSDLQAAGLGADPRLARDLDLEVRSVSGPVENNLTLAAAWLEPETSRPDGRQMLRARVVNTGARAASSRLTVQVGGLPAGEREVSLAPGASDDVLLPVFPSPLRATRIGLALDDDALVADNRRFLVAPPRRALSLLVVSEGEASPYLDAALALAREPAVAVRRVTPAQLDGGMLDEADVVILDAPIAGAVDTVLTARVAAGLGVLAFATVAQGAAALLPPRGSAAPDLPAAGGRMRAVAASHALAMTLGGGDLAVGPVWRRVAVTPGAGDVVLARFDDGIPALLERLNGKGRVLYLATSPAPAWSDLALRPEFAPFLLQAVTTLAGVTPARQEHAPGSALHPGSLARSLALVPADADALSGALARGEDVTLRTPDGGRVRLGPKQSVILDAPGFHELRAGTAAPMPLAVSVVAGESRLDSLAVDEFRTRIARPPRPGPSAGASAAGPAGAGGERDRDESLAWALLLVGLAALLAESLLAALTARHRVTAEAPA